MPLISIGNHVTNIDKDSLMQELLDDINRAIPNEVVVQEWTWERWFRKPVKTYSAYYKTNDYDAEQLVGHATEREMELFLMGLMLAWDNPIRNLRRIK